jgi:excinuclease ABC subunit C
VGKVTEADYRQIVNDLCAFLGGSTQKYIRELQIAMKQAASEERYEDAAKLRDQLGALDRVLERNAVALADATDADFIAAVDDPLHVGVEVFHVRAGRVVGERSFIVERAEDLELDGYVQRILQRLYGGGLAGDQSGVPKEILVNELPSDVETVCEWLGNLRSGPVHLHVPKRGDKAQLMETATGNASQALDRHKLKRSSDITARSAALAQLQEDLGLSEPPFRIECIDISTLQGTDTVASVVVFEDALPVKNQYRTYKVKTEGADDLTAVREIVERRFAPREDGESEPRHRYPTSLLVIDGAAGQVRAAEEALAAVGRSDLPVIGLAKRLEEVWTSEDPEPVILSRTSEGLFLLQRIRDEAHRVAISFHRKRRSQRSRGSVLDSIPGLGPARAKALLKRFGSVKAIAEATLGELTEVPGIGPVLAKTIQNTLASNHGPDS